MTGTPQSRRHFLSTLAASLGAAAFFVSTHERVGVDGPMRGQRFDAVMVDDPLPPYATLTRWCPEHGEYEQDCDAPELGCPLCTFKPRYVFEELYAPRRA